MNTIKKLFQKCKLMSVAAKAAVAYMLASLFTKGLGIITTPLFTRIMSTAEIGEFSTFSSWYSLISVVATLSLSSGAFSLAMFEFKDQRDEYSSSMLGLSFVSVSVVALIYLLNPPFWNQILSLNTTEVVVMLAAFYLIPATDYRLVRLRYEYKYKTLVAISMTNAVMGTALSIFAVLVSRHFNAANLAVPRIAGLYTVLCTMGAVNGIYIICKGKSLYNRRFWKFALLNSTPLIVNALAKHILEISDRIMITSMVGKSATGIYSTLYTVSTLSLIVWSAIEANLLPYIFENLKNKQEQRISNIVKPLLFAFACVCLLLALVAPEIVRLLATEEYSAAINIMPPVVCGVFFSSVYNLFGDVLLYHKKTYYIMLSTTVAAVSNLLMNYVFIHQFGYLAASYTTLASYIILAVMQYIFMYIVHQGKVYDMAFIALLSVTLVCFTMLCLILYSYLLVRYLLVIALLLLAVIFRNKLAGLFKTMKKKGLDS